MKKTVNAFDYAGEICKQMKKGILLTVRDGAQLNTMTIGWGTVGIEWGKPIFIAFVRHSRHTKDMLDRAGEFTVNVPLGEADKNILSFCGTKSGRDVDKFAQLGLTAVDSDIIATPGIKQLPLTLECKVLYAQDQQIRSIPEDIIGRYYPQLAENEDFYANRDIHTAYYAEIVNAYIIED